MNAPVPARAANVRFLLRHPAHFIALGAGSGLSPVAPGTAGTLWAWLCFDVLNPHVPARDWAWILVGGLVVGWWACTRAAQGLGTPDPGPVVWDEIIAFWLVLVVIAPGGFAAQCAAFVLFRFFDAAKPGPVGWADRAFKTPSPKKQDIALAGTPQEGELPSGAESRGSASDGSEADGTKSLSSAKARAAESGRVNDAPLGPTISWREGWGILFDDLVAAACALFCMALWKWFWA